MLTVDRAIPPNTTQFRRSRPIAPDPPLINTLSVGKIVGSRRHGRAGHRRLCRTRRNEPQRSRSITEHPATEEPDPTTGHETEATPFSLPRSKMNHRTAATLSHDTMSVKSSVRREQDIIDDVADCPSWFAGVQTLRQSAQFLNEEKPEQRYPT